MTTWLRAQEGTFVYLDHVGATRYGPEGGRPGIHRVTTDVISGASVVRSRDRKTAALGSRAR